jgi:arylsulfatase A-like enzyme
MARFLLAALLLLIPAAAPQAARPNFVIMMCDDQRWDAMSLYGNTVLKTPHMDRIGREGVMFRNAFVVNALCAPSRATLLTGTYSHTNGVIDNRNREIRKEAPWMPGLLKEAGYQVAFCGKSHLKGALRDRPWDYYFGFQGQGNYLKPRVAEGPGGKDEPHEGWMDDVVTGKALSWMKSGRDATKPFALFLFFKAPHRSWVRAPRHSNLFEGVEVPKPALWDDPAAGKPRAFLEADNRVGSANDILDYQKFMKDYYACIAGADDNVGRVFEALEGLKILDDTMLLHTGDNGFFLGEWQRFDKRFMHEVSIRVPMVVRYPRRIPAGSVSDAQVLNVDIAPTILDVAGVAVPAGMQGRSWTPLFKDPKAAFREDWYYEYYEYPDAHKVKPHRGVRSAAWKLIHYYEAPEEFELYDLAKDPSERDNLHGKPGMEEITKKLRTRIDELRRETGDR